MAALWWFWHFRDYGGEALRQIERALASDADLPTRLRARLLNGAVFLLNDWGDYERSVALGVESVDLCRQVGDDGETAFALASLGLALRFRADFPAASAALEESLDRAHRSGDPFHVARALNNLGVLAIGLGRFDRAVELLTESLGLWRQLRIRGTVAQGLLGLGLAVQQQGDDARAESLLEESMALSRAEGYARITAWGLQFLGDLALRRGDARKAAELYHESLALLTRLGHKLPTARCLEGLATATARRDLPRQAVRLFGAAQALREVIGAPVPPYQIAAHERELAALRSRLGDAAFDAAWDEGKAMGLDQVCAEPLIGQAPADRPQTGAPKSIPPQPDHPLTQRELEVVALIARGLTNRQIAEALVITPGTAGIHVGNILRKLELHSRAQIAVWAARSLRSGEG